MGCRHCGHEPANRPRGLCWNCYYAPGIRERYQTPSPYARRYTDRDGEAEPSGNPCLALPGTAEKIAILAQRAALRLALWHPGDVRLLDRPEPHWREWQREGEDQ
ncbi:MAG: hypothetical protein ACREYF_10300 [Gammaproteobacteria bacterium]